MKDFKANHVGRSTLGEEKARFLDTDVENGAVAPRVVEERDVYVGGQTLIDSLQSFFQVLYLIVLGLEDLISQVCETL